MTAPSGELPQNAEKLREDERRFPRQRLDHGASTPQRNACLSGFSPEVSRERDRRGWLSMTWPAPSGGHERSTLERFVDTGKLLAAGAPVAAHGVEGRPHEMLGRGGAGVAQRQDLFPGMTGAENVAMGGYLPRDRALVDRRLAYWPRAAPHAGGQGIGRGRRTLRRERQPLKIARVLMTEPREPEVHSGQEGTPDEVESHCREVARGRAGRRGLRIGAVLSLASKYAPSAEYVEVGYKYWADTVSKADRIPTVSKADRIPTVSQVELIIPDAKCEPSAAATLSRGLVEKEAVSFIPGSYGSNSTDTMAAVVDPLKVPMLGTIASDSAVRERHGLKWTFHAFPSSTHDHEAFLAIAQRRGYDRITIVNEKGQQTGMHSVSTQWQNSKNEISWPTGDATAEVVPPKANRA